MTKITKINTNKLQKLIDNDDCHIVDVREPDEYKASHIPGSYNIPLGDISKSSFSELKDKKIVIHCQSGMRSSKGCKQALTYTEGEIFDLEGGMMAWKDEGGKIAKQGCGFSIMQQVQIIVGSMVLLGVVLSQAHSEQWVYFSGFFGAGLLFAGLTGWCGMAKFLSFMPWNK